MKRPAPTLVPNRDVKAQYFTINLLFTSEFCATNCLVEASRGLRKHLTECEHHINICDQGLSVMKKLLAVAALAVAVPAQAAVVVNFTPGVGALPPGTVVYEDFEDEANGAVIGTNAKVFNASVAGQAARPAFGSTGNFGAVLGEPTDGEYITNFATSNVFSFILGSLDTYNTLEILLSDATSIIYSGNQITQGLQADGDQADPDTNGRVTYTVTGGGPFIVGARFRSSQNSFEFDNLAIRAVPEPATWMMMILGFGAIGFGMRRRSAGKLALA